jgi:hypothetical protein
MLPALARQGKREKGCITNLATPMFFRLFDTKLAVRKVNIGILV